MTLLFTLSAALWLSPALAQLDTTRKGLFTEMSPINNQAPLGLLTAIRNPIDNTLGQIPSLGQLDLLKKGNAITRSNQGPASNQFDVVKFTRKGLGSLPAPVAPQLDILKPVQGGIITELSALKDPVDKTVTFVGSSQCSNVKTILGMEYSQMNFLNNEPNLSQLTLNFITRSISVSYNLSSAATSVPASSWFNPQNGLIIYMHGFIEDPTMDSFTNVSNAFLSQGNFNILALDSSSLIRFLYLRASTYVQFIGERLGEVLAALYQVGLKPSSIHLIGHSLGAHISGFAGKTFYRLTGQRVGRISGLDPAGPCFTAVDDSMKLNRTDADFVDVIHTDDGVYGLNEQLGHVDFYPNGGSAQPNCLLQMCSHNRVWLLYAESVVSPRSFPAVSCSSWANFKNQKCNFTDVSLMGHACSPDTRGVYYLQTAPSVPFGRGNEGLNFYNNEGVLRNLGSLVTPVV